MENTEPSELSPVSGQMDLRVKVAELCPNLFELHETWSVEHQAMRTFLTRKGEGVTGDEIDPLCDLNACHEFEHKWHDSPSGAMWYNYMRALDGICGKAGDDPRHATAEQRCRAFVKTMERPSSPSGTDSSSATREKDLEERGGRA
jgi:hypothetical protein